MSVVIDLPDGTHMVQPEGPYGFQHAYPEGVMPPDTPPLVQYPQPTQPLHGGSINPLILIGAGLLFVMLALFGLSHLWRKPQPNWPQQHFQEIPIEDAKPGDVPVS